MYYSPNGPICPSCDDTGEHTARAYGQPLAIEHQYIDPQTERIWLCPDCRLCCQCVRPAAAGENPVIISDEITYCSSECLSFDVCGCEYDPLLAIVKLRHEFLNGYEIESLEGRDIDTYAILVEVIAQQVREMEKRVERAGSWTRAA